MNHDYLHLKDVALTIKKKQIFSNIKLKIPVKKWIGIIGQSGIGKSSLLKMVAGIRIPQAIYSGEIYTASKTNMRSACAYMAQKDLLFPWLTVLENTTLFAKFNHQISEHHVVKAKILLQEVGLAASIHAYPCELSGGMRQRVALVRTLLQNKPIILMDEAFSALDIATRHHLHKLAKFYLQHKTVLFVTHDPFEAIRLADEIYIMHGQPASLTLMAKLTSETPRDLIENHYIQNLYGKLVKALTVGLPQ